MQTTQATQEDIARWKRVYEEYRPRLRPNRISGAALFAYLESRYPLRPLKDPQYEQVVSDNILLNDCFARLLPQGKSPEPVCCAVEQYGAGLPLYRTRDAIYEGCDIFVGIDRVCGYFLVEGSPDLWDELYAQRGLNEDDLTNAYSVAEYIDCLEKFGMLDEKHL